MSFNISDVQGYPSLFEALNIGKRYFDIIYTFSQFFGEDTSAIDCAEILIYLMNNQNQFIQRNLIVDTLNLNTSKVDVALKRLKNMNMVSTFNKGLLWTGKFPYPKNISVDDAFAYADYFDYIHTINTDGDNYWKTMSLIHAISSWIGLGIPTCSRRHFTASLCMGKPYECSSKTAKKIQQVLDTLDIKELAFRYETDTFKQMVKEKTELKVKRGRLLGTYQKAKLLLYRQDWWQRGIPKTIPKQAVSAYELCCDYFPYTDSESKYDTFNKRNIFLWEYIVNQPCMKDTDFNAFSPFYGLPLEDRLELLPNTIGTDSEEYQKHFLRQDQWQRVFNDTADSFVIHKYIDRTKDPKYKDATALTKWDTSFQKKKHRQVKIS